MKRAMVEWTNNKSCKSYHCSDQCTLQPLVFFRHFPCEISTHGYKD